MAITMTEYTGRGSQRRYAPRDDRGSDHQVGFPYNANWWLPPAFEREFIRIGATNAAGYRYSCLKSNGAGASFDL